MLLLQHVGVRDTTSYQLTTTVTQFSRPAPSPQIKVSPCLVYVFYCMRKINCIIHFADFWKASIRLEMTVRSSVRQYRITRLPLEELSNKNFTL